MKLLMATSVPLLPLCSAINSCKLPYPLWTSQPRSQANQHVYYYIGQQGIGGPILAMEESREGEEDSVEALSVPSISV